jgi:hypothetical protein
VRAAALEAYAHQELPFEKLVAELRPVRDLSRNPLVQVMFVLQNTPMPVVNLPGVELVRGEIAEGPSNFDLTLSLAEVDGTLRGVFAYAVELFDESTVARLAEHFQTLLAGIVADPAQRSWELSLMTEQERQRVLSEWDATTVSTATVRRIFEGQADLSRLIDNAGRMFILGQNGEPVPIGVPGELHLEVPEVSRSDPRRPTVAMERLISHNLKPNICMCSFKTGYLARRLNDGTVRVIGKLESLVRSQGYRIDLREVESALSEHPEVEEATVTAQEDPWGDQRLVGYVVFRHDGTVPSWKLRSFLRATLPSYMVPGTFVALEALPLSPDGRVDRRALPTPDWDSAEHVAPDVGPLTSEEEVLSEIWADALKRDHVGITDDFFDMGGHSMLAIQVVSRIREILGMEISLRQFFETPTVSALAKRMSAAQDA